jgi:PST family polysaccharide transporter
MEPIEATHETSYTGIFSAFRLLFSATFLTMALGIATNKAIALGAGPDGIAFIGLYRNLINTLVSVLSVGMTTVVVQKMSTSSEEEVSELVQNVLCVLMFQLLVILLLAFFFSRFISGLLFSSAVAASHEFDIKIVLLMAIGVLVMQTMTTLLNGKVNVKRITVINVATSLATFVMVLPLLKLGNTGLAIMVGSGSLVGALIATVYASEVFNLHLSSLKFTINLRKNFSSLPISSYLIIHPILMTGSFTIIQVIINRFYGLNDLGYYNALLTIESASLAVIMSSLRTYYLPTLGQIKNQQEKEDFVNKIITMILISLLPLTAGLILGSKYVLWILYSDKFSPASTLVSLQSMAMLIHAYTWCYAYFLNHKARYGVYLLLDAIWAALLVGGTWFVSVNGYNLTSVVVNYLFACTVMFSMYLFVILRLYGRRMLQARNIKLGLTTLLLVLFSFMVSLGEDNVISRILVFGIISAYTFYQLKRHCFRRTVSEQI